jgi:hypothetical protein
MRAGLRDIKRGGKYQFERYVAEKGMLVIDEARQGEYSEGLFNIPKH